MHAHRRTGVGVLVEPRRHLLGGSRVQTLDVEARLGLLLRGLDGVEQPVAQHPELEPVEDLVHLVAVPVLAGQVVDVDAGGRRRSRAVQPPVAQDPVEVLAQRLPRLALDLVDVRDDTGRGRRTA